MAERWSTPPSKLLHIDGEYAAWCIDEAVFAFGNHVESEINSASNSAMKGHEVQARMDRLNAILSTPHPDAPAIEAPTDNQAAAPAPNTFADPASMMATRR